MAQPVFDAATAVDSGAAVAASLTYSHTVTGANPGLMGGCALRSATIGVTTFKYNAIDGDGAAAIAIATGGNAHTEMWQFSAPATGAHNFVITPSSAAQMVGTGHSATGCDQTDCLGTAVSNQATAVQALSVTDAAADADRLYVVAFCKRDSTEAPTADAGQNNDTQDVTTNATGANNCYGATSNEGGAASVTMGYTWPTTNRNGAIAMAGFIAVAAGGIAIPVLTRQYRERWAA